LAELAASATERAPSVFFEGDPEDFCDFRCDFFFVVLARDSALDPDEAADARAADFSLPAAVFFELLADVVVLPPVVLLDDFFTDVFFLDAPLVVDLFGVVDSVRAADPAALVVFRLEPDFFRLLVFRDDDFAAAFFFEVRFLFDFFDAAARADDDFFEPAPERVDFDFLVEPARDVVFRREAVFLLVDFLATAETLSDTDKSL
jgi:hypothetical protein